MSSSQSSSHFEPHQTVDEFPTRRQPYWRDPRVQVVTETRLVINAEGRRVIEKKKYLEYPEGWIGARDEVVGDTE